MPPVNLSERFPCGSERGGVRTRGMLRDQAEARMKPACADPFYVLYPRRKASLALAGGSLAPIIGLRRPAMHRFSLVISLVCFLTGFAVTVRDLTAHGSRRSPYTLFAAALGFGFQTLWLYQRGQVLGRCPLTSLFDILVFLAWSVSLLYLVTGATYRLSLLGALSFPLVVVLETIALFLPEPLPPPPSPGGNPWLEFHAAVSVVAYGAFSLAGLAGVMLLAQERQLKTHRLSSFFFRMPPIQELAAANRRLIYTGFALLSAGLVAGVTQGMAHVSFLKIVSVLDWVVYGFLCVALSRKRITPRRASWLAIAAGVLLLLSVGAVQVVGRS